MDVLLIFLVIKIYLVLNRHLLKIILIKRPSKEELELLTTDLAQFMKVNPKVVLTDTINITGSFSRFVGETTTPNAPGKNNFVKNKLI